MEIFAIRLTANVFVRDDLAFAPGQLLEVKRVFENASHNGLPTVLAVWEGQEFYVRGWEYTPDLTADPAQLVADALKRLEARVEKGLRDWRAVTQRARSAEVDFGGWWTLHGDPRELEKWSVSWVADTGEIYAWNARDDGYIVLGATERNDEARAEFLLEGWCDTESAVFHNLTALEQQLRERQGDRTPEALVKRFARKERWRAL